MEFKKEEGKEIEANIIENRKDLREKKLLVKKITVEINSLKKEIDKIKEMLQRKEEEREGEAPEDKDIIDEEQYMYIQQLKEHKKTYQYKFNI
jgi:uncharacterized membrane protein YgaE (UPF0421/DUF939 family)